MGYEKHETVDLQQKRLDLQESSQLSVEEISAMQQGISAQLEVLKKLFPNMKVG